MFHYVPHRETQAVKLSLKCILLAFIVMVLISPAPLILKFIWLVSLFFSLKFKFNSFQLIKVSQAMLLNKECIWVVSIHVNQKWEDCKQISKLLLEIHLLQGRGHLFVPAAWLAST